MTTQPRSTQPGSPAPGSGASGSPAPGSPAPRRKVFCLGFQKTGTSSLGLALERLGYDVTGYHPFRPLAGRPGLTLDDLWAVALPLAQAHDAAQDTPWPVLYERLDAAFPDARFIHVVRDRDAWIRSVANDFGKHRNEIHRLIYGSDCPTGNEAAWLARYDRHNREVRAHFAGREDRFLSLDMARGEVGWERVCRFLGHEVPDAPWPHANTRNTKRMKLLWWRGRDRARRLLGLS